MDCALNVAIILTGHAYLPEAWAYHRHLIARGWPARVVDHPDAARGADLAITFSLAHQWALQRLGVPAVHEYHSLSAGRWRHAKDAVKRLAAPPAAGRIFSEQPIAQRMRFAAGPPVLIRPMGVDAAIYGCTQNAAPTHDIVYCGSFGRSGVADALMALAHCGWRVVAFGAPDDAPVRTRLESAGVDLPGAIAREQVPAALARARFGLNFTPDIAPLNRQTSVKSLEYAAAGLTIIANRYPWIERFAREQGAPVQWLDDVLAMGAAGPGKLAPQPAEPGQMAQLEWDRLLDRVGFKEFLERCVAEHHGHL